MKRILKAGRPSPAMIVAVSAVILALGGTAVAGSVLTKKQFKKQAVSKKQFKNQALTGPITYKSTTVSVLTTSAAATTIVATCPGGYHPIGGSARSTTPSATNAFFALQQYPTTGAWTAQVYVFGPPAESVIVTAICAKAKKTSGALTGSTG